jgi:hypothetical protein
MEPMDQRLTPRPQLPIRLTKNQVALRDRLRARDQLAASGSIDCVDFSEQWPTDAKWEVSTIIVSIAAAKVDTWLRQTEGRPTGNDMTDEEVHDAIERSRIIEVLIQNALDEMRVMRTRKWRRRREGFLFVEDAYWPPARRADLDKFQASYRTRRCPSSPREEN